MIKRVGGALTGLVLVLLALITGATPALAGRLAGSAPGTPAFIVGLLQPDPPTGLTANTASSTEVDLSWAAPTGGSTPAGYNVYDGTSPGGESSTPVNSAPVTDTTFPVKGLSPDTTYYFVMTAVDAANNASGSSNEALALTYSGPDPPDGLTANTVSSTEVDLSWTAPSGDLAVGYNVYEGTSPGGESSTPVNSASVTGTTFSVTGLSPGTTYYFEVTAVDAGGTASDFSTEASATTTNGPDPPTGLTANTVSSTEVDLSWTAPSGVPAVGYNVYEGTSPGGESSTPVNSAPVTGTTFPVTGLSGGTTYYFEVTAVDAGGTESGFSTEASATTTPAPGSLGPPTGLTAKTVSSTEVDLSWTAPSGGSPPAGYNVYEGTRPGGESSTPVNSAPVTGTTFSVAGLSRRTTYYFEVKAVDAAGNKSGFSNEAPATTPGPGPHASPTGPGPPARHAGPGGTSVQSWLVPVALAATGGAMAGALIMLRRRRSQSAPGPGTHAAAGPGIHGAAGPSVRAVPHDGPPRVVSIHRTGTEATYTVRIEPHPSEGITTIEEAPPR